jgi:phosphoglycerate kinase
MKAMLELEDLDLANLGGVRTLVRVDFNVPMTGEHGDVVGDTTRLEEALPTLRELHAAGARVVLASHHGRPKGQPNPKYTLRPVAAKLAELWGQPVSFAPDCVGAAAAAVLAALAPGGVCLLENLRYHAGEEQNDPGFADQLAALADAYVDDAFGSAHRAHASVVGVAQRLSRKAAGRLLVREVSALGRLLFAPEKPFAALLGGAKIADKTETLENLLPKLDILMIGGGMANTFLVAQGLDLQASLVEREAVSLAGEILQRARQQGVQVLLPTDLVVADDLTRPRQVLTVPAAAVPAGLKALDVGPETRRAFAEAIGRARTLFWNGPLGVFEQPPFAAGTREVALALAGCPGFTVCGGGETVAAARQAGVLERIGHVSTGGGASLEFLAGKVLPGVAVLERG